MNRLLSAAILSAGLLGCGGNEADELGVGAQCGSSSDCNPDIGAVCLTPFKGGYCGLMGCATDADCPDASACILWDTAGTTYCFRTCTDKAECNANRDPANESNCSSNVMFKDGAMGRKACVPPSA